MNRREYAVLLEHFGGDAKKVAAMKKTLAKGGTGGALVMEMLRGSIDADDDFDGAESADFDHEASQSEIDEILAFIDGQAGVAIKDREARIEEIQKCIDEEEHLASAEIFMRLFEERAIDLCLDGLYDEGDHAAVVEMFAAATQGAWQPLNCQSKAVDDENRKFEVRFTDSDSESRKWRFRQDGDFLSENFLENLIRHCEAQSGLKVVPLEASEIFQAIVVPTDFAEALRATTFLD